MKKLDKRGSGILLHISSLPSNYGIGTFGEEAYRFADFLKESGQSYWQILPLGQTSFGDSPYQSFSINAGNPYFIDLDLLAKDGLLKKEDYISLNWGDNSTQVDYGLLYNTRYEVLKKAFENFNLNDINYKEFLKKERDWLRYIYDNEKKKQQLILGYLGY
jgi:4-alpha-glucanotransferase